jgi:plasmid maintenance system killer protein
LREAIIGQLYPATLLARLVTLELEGRGSRKRDNGAAESIEGLSRPSFRLHALKGQLKGFWSVAVRANWRVIFRFADGRASDVDFVDYH